MHFSSLLRVSTLFAAVAVRLADTTMADCDQARCWQKRWASRQLGFSLRSGLMSRRLPSKTSCGPGQVLASEVSDKARVSDFLGDAGAVSSSLGALKLTA